jgi:predicted nuclease of restriction endonuclease-like RecB superfamily
MMLPSELLVVWKRRGVIFPRYAKPSDDNLELARAIIETYGSRVGEKKSVLKAFAGELEDRGCEYRFVRGLSFLLDKRSVFKCNDRVGPVDLRRKIYQATEKFGLPTTQELRGRIINSVAAELKLTPEAVEESFYADLDSELILEKFDPLAPMELLEQYNLSLTQTLLFDCTELNFTASGNWQGIFYAIKRLGLIYDASKNGRFWVKVDGPASLFKLNKRYGTATAKLLPLILANPEWTVEAKILWKYTNEICNFKIESWKHRAILKQPQLPTISYDSTVEEDFATRFQASKSGWHLKREPEPVLAGKHVIIPDFSLERDGNKVYLEIVGFWTMDYLLRKIGKLKQVNAKMLVAVNETLACEKLADLKKYSQLKVIYYRDRIPLPPILRYLEEAFRGVQTKQAGFIKDLHIVFTEPVINFEELATRIGVSAEAAKTALTENPPQDYLALPNSLVRKDVVEQIDRRIGDQIKQAGRLLFSEAAKIIEADGVHDATSVLENLGYKVVWHGINTEKAEVTKP